MNFNWNNDKNKQLAQNRNITFEEIVIAFENGCIIEIMKHPNLEYPDQFMILVNIRDYVYCVPAVVNGSEFFLKTVYPSRKYTKKYLGK